MRPSAKYRASTCPPRRSGGLRRRAASQAARAEQLSNNVSSPESAADASDAGGAASGSADLVLSADAAANAKHARGSRGSIDVPDTGGLKSTPMGAGVHNATDRFALPSPTLAVRNLIEGAQFAHLCTNMSGMHHRRAGYPFGMLVDFACDGAGFPIFCLSPLSIHSHNLHEDPRCSMVVQMPGWAGLSNARVTIFGDVFALPANMQDAAKEVFMLKHHGADGQHRVISDSFRFYRMMQVRDIYFVGGFGTMQWIDVEDYTATKPDTIVMYHPHDTIDMLNDALGERLAERLGGAGEVISIDAMGMDVRVRHEWDTTMHRVSFATKVHAPDALKRAAMDAVEALRTT